MTQTLDAVGNFHDQKGQFSGHVQVEGDTDVLLQDAPQQDWGDVSNVREGSRTPWGEAQHVTHPAPGIVSVSTAGHGGIKLSPERNRAVPPALRQASGWYEEDCESHIVAFVHPEAFPHYLGGNLDAIREDGRQGVLRWYPEEYEKATGEEIPFGVSSSKDEKAWKDKVAGQALLTGIHATEHPDYPGMVVAETHEPDGTSSRHLIPVADFAAIGTDTSYGACKYGCYRPVPATAIRVPTVKAAKPAKAPITTVAVEKLTASQQARATAELDKRWRDRDGRIFTMREDIAAGRYCGKTVTYDSAGKAEYHLRLTEGDSRIMPVSKAVWDAFDAPDERTPADLALAKWRTKQAMADRAGRNYDRAAAMKLGREAQQLHEEYTRLNEAESAARKPVYEAERAAREASDKALLDAAYAKAKADGLV